MNLEFLEIPLINLETRARSENAEIRWKLTNLLNGKIDENDGTRAGKTEIPFHFTHDKIRPRWKPFDNKR